MTCMLMLSLIVPCADFPICTAPDVQQYPCAVFGNDQYYVFWIDDRYYLAESTHAVFGARVSTNGTVVDPGGKLLFERQAGFATSAAFDGTNLLVVFRDSC
ncbi:MAG: hypothetical protein JSW49_10035 [candidate division WOR-3 bacterium]|nr:MAG: hypothetical protein JSW49_10035 [candidate division WOR-3 bacterium]